MGFYVDVMGDAWKKILGYDPRKVTVPLQTPTTETVPNVTADTIGPQIGAALNGQTELQTMRAAGDINIPTTLRQYLPLLMIFVLVVLIFFKK